MAAPFGAGFYPLGLRLEIATNDRRVLGCAESSFGVFPKAECAGQPLRLRFLRLESGAAPPWPAAACRAWGGLFSVVCGPDNFVTADLARGTAMGFFSPAMLDDREFFRWTFLDCAVYMMLQRRGLTPVHGACVVREERGICLCGPAGAGKTSLAYCCARAGYRLLADDVLFLRRSPAGLRLRGNPARLHLPLDARQLFPEFSGMPAGVRHDGSEFLVLQTRDVLPGCAITQAEPGAVVVLARGAARPFLEEITAEEAHRLLFSTLPRMDDEPTMAAHQAAIRELVREGAYRLHYSSLDDAQRQLDALRLPQRISE